MIRRRLFALCFFPLAMVACQSAQDRGSEMAQAEIRALHESALAALRNAELDKMVAVYMDEVISLPPGQPALVGKRAVRAMWQDVLASFQGNVTVDIEEIQILGDWAYERGTYRMELMPKAGGAPINDTGKYLDILRRTDGQWRYWRVSWNSSQQPQCGLLGAA